ncbi:MAG: hypothetical protein AAF936_08885 [Pseudomonadota bacterium]
MKSRIIAVWNFIKKLRLIVFGISAVLGSVAWFVILKRDDPEQLQDSVREQIDLYTYLINSFFSGFGLWEPPLSESQQLWFVLWVFFAFVNFKFLQGVGRRMKNIAVDKYHRHQGYAREGKKWAAKYADMPFDKFLREQGYLNDGTVLSAILAVMFGPFLPILVGVLLVFSILKPSIFTVIIMMAVYWYGSALLLESLLFMLVRGLALLI